MNSDPSSGAPQSTDLRGSVLLGLLLALLTLAVFEPAFDHEFVDFDDDVYVYQSPYAQSGLSWQGTIWAFRQPYASNWHPLAVLSHMADIELFGLDPRGHHLTSVLLHIANVLLLFAFLRSALRDVATPWNVPASALGAALFAVHPLRVESVVWVSERKDLLCAFFVLLALWAHLRFARRPSAGRYGSVVLFGALALLAKPMAVTLPFVLLLLDVWPLGRLVGAGGPDRPGRWKTLGRLVVEKVPLVLLALLAAWATVLAQSRTLALSAGPSLPMRLANACVSYARYLGKTFWPQDLAFYYPYPQQLEAWKVAGAAVLLAAVTAVAVSLWRRTPAPAIGWLWFTGMLMPVSGVMKAGDQAMADRYTYLPSIGLVIALVWGLPALLPPRALRPSAALGVMLVFLWVPLTRAQVSVWSDSETLYRHALEKTAHNYLAHVNLAEVLRSQRRLDEALEQYRAAVEARPDKALTQGAFGQALRLAGRFEEAKVPLRRAVELDPQDVRYLVNLGTALAATGGDQEAEGWLRRAVALAPGDVQAHVALGEVLARRGEVGEALYFYRLALRLLPNHPKLLAAIGELESSKAPPKSPR